MKETDPVPARLSVSKGGNLRTLRFLLSGLAGAAFFLAVVVLFWGWAFRPTLTESRPVFDQQKVAEAARLRAIPVDWAHPLVIHRAVDLSEGAAAAWYPKGESPILTELVAKGELPPVAERVGPEPAVLGGVDGIGRYGGTWSMAIGTAFDNIRIGDIFSGAGLVRWSPLGKPVVPHVAKQIDVSPDQREFVFHLRKGMRWSDGVPFTSEDILYAWKYEALMPEAGVFGEPPPLMVARGELGTVEAIDAHTVRFRFAAPNAIFLEKLATYEGLFFTDAPAHYLKQYHPVAGDQALINRTMQALQLATPRSLYGRIKGRDNPDHPHLWPWVYRAYKANPPYGYVRNPYYFAVDPAGNQLPYFDRLLWDIKSPDMIPIATAGGEETIQYYYNRFENYTMFMAQRERYGFSVRHWYPTNGSEFLINPNLNRQVLPGDAESKNKHALLNDRRFRQALSLAINRRVIIAAGQSGVGTPVQVSPSPDSPFYLKKLREAFVEYDPARANALLDEIGLTHRDGEGFRTFADGSRMHFYISMTKDFSVGVAQLVAEDWVQVGVRVTVRERARQLYYQELQGLLHDFSIWSSNDDFNPMLEPRPYLPSAWDSDFAKAWAKWYRKGGLYGRPEAGEMRTPPPSPDHPLYRAMQLYEDAKSTPDREQREGIFREILEIAAENVWTINLTTPPPIIVVVKNGVRNVPDAIINGWTYLSPLNAGPETFFMEHPSDSPGAVAAMQKDIRQVTPWPDSIAARADAATGLGAWLATGLRVLIYGSLGLGLILIALRHPFIARRLLLMVPTLAMISVLSFMIIQLPPGDFLSSKIIQIQETGGAISESDIAELREMFHLDASPVEQYSRWLGLHWFTTFEAKDQGLLQGYLGRSMDSLQSVNLVMGDRLVLTVVLSLGSILLTWLLAIPIGIYSAVRQYSRTDYFFSLIGFLGMSVPSFLLAIIIMFLSAKYLGVNVTGLFSATFAAQPEWSGGKVVDLLKHVWVPVLILAVGGTAGMIRVMRGNLLDELKKPYVITAMAKGVRPLRLLMKYPVRLALNPFISSIGSVFPELVSGGAIVSLVLSLPTIGPLLLDALLMEDLYVAGSMLMVLSLLGVMGTLVSDLLLLALDPRIRMTGGSK